MQVLGLEQFCRAGKSHEDINPGNTMFTATCPPAAKLIDATRSADLDIKTIKAFQNRPLQQYDNVRWKKHVLEVCG